MKRVNPIETLIPIQRFHRFFQLGRINHLPAFEVLKEFRRITEFHLALVLSLRRSKHAAKAFTEYA